MSNIEFWITNIEQGHHLTTPNKKISDTHHWRWRLQGYAPYFQKEINFEYWTSNIEHWIMNWTLTRWTVDRWPITTSNNDYECGIMIYGHQRRHCEWRRIEAILILLVNSRDWVKFVTSSYYRYQFQIEENSESQFRIMNVEQHLITTTIKKCQTSNSE